MIANDTWNRKGQIILNMKIVIAEKKPSEIIPLKKNIIFSINPKTIAGIIKCFFVTFVYRPTTNGTNPLTISSKQAASIRYLIGFVNCKSTKPVFSQPTTRINILISDIIIILFLLSIILFKI